MIGPKILVAGIGNIFHGDDAFGVEVAQRLARRPQADGVRIGDFGIRGFDLTYALLDGYSTVILVDATPRGGTPGTIYVIRPEIGGGEDAPPTIEPHGMDPVRVLRLAKSMGAELNQVLLVGCEPGPVSPDEDRIGLSEPVKGAVDEAVKTIESLISDLLASKLPAKEARRPAEH